MAELVFYRHKHGRLLDHLIGWLTWGKHSHVEFVLSPSPKDSRRDGLQLGVSSSWRDGGVRDKRLALGSGKWTRYRISTAAMSIQVELRIAEWFVRQRGKKYDTLGVAMTPFTWWKRKVFRKSRWFCSEICSYVCKNWGAYNFPTTQLSPNRMERICAANPDVFILLSDNGEILADEEEERECLPVEEWGL
jgi:hypothetical protein